MPNRIIFYALSAGFVFLTLGGCASSGASKEEKGGIETRAYIANREREDQDMSEGNFGYLSGSPQPADRSNVKKTRQVYVVEVTKNVPVPKEVAEFQIPERKQLPLRTTAYESDVDERYQPVELPAFDGEPAVDEPAPGGMTEYTVEKNDTLQKIAKKFYGSYGKWTKIYAANKNVIPDPNRIKPGIVLQIPIDGGAPVAEASSGENLK